MGDKYWLELNCAWCGKLNAPEDECGFKGVFYAPTCGEDDIRFNCEYCGKPNLILESFKAIKDEKDT